MIRRSKAPVHRCFRVSAFQTAMINIVSPALTRLAEPHRALRVEVEWAEPERAIDALVGRGTTSRTVDELEKRMRARRLWYEEPHDERVRLVLPIGHRLDRRPDESIDVLRSGVALSLGQGRFS